jgi:integrase
MKFTQENVTKIRPPAGKADHWEPDEGLKGFCIRFQKGGPGSYFIRYSFNGKPRRLPLGRIDQIKLEDAKTKARKAFGQIADKIDPAVERAKAVAKHDLVIDEALLDRFKIHLQNKNRSPDHIERSLAYLAGTERHAYFRPLHKIPLGQLDRATVARELSNIEEENGPLAMTRARGALSKFLNWMIGEGYEITNVVEGTKKYESEARDRVLSPDELRIIWQNAGEGQHGQIVRLLMLTGARRTQIGSLKKVEVKLAKSEIAIEDRVIVLPGQGKKGSRKGGSKHSDKFLLALSTQAIKILESVTEREDSEFVFGEGKGGFSGWSKAKAALDERIGDKITESWGFHDFRRSFETLGHDVCKIPDSHTDYCLNHKPQSKQGIRGRYNYAKYLDEKRAAMQTWGDYIEGLIKPKLKAVA